MKLKISLLFFTALGLISVQAQQNGFTLKQAQDYAVENAYSVKTSALEVQNSKKILAENIARGLPQVFASANWTKNINLQSFVLNTGNGFQQITAGTPYSVVGNITAEQLIFDGSYIVAIMAGKVLEENSIYQKEKSEIDIKEEVAKAYHLVLVSNKTVEIVEENLVFIEKNFDETKSLFEAGFAEETDVDQLELIKSNLENQIDFAKKQANIALMLLNFQMGIPVEQSTVLTDDIEKLMLFSEDGESLLSETFTVEENVDYRILETQERGQELNLKNERAAYYPKLKFNYLYGHNIFSANAYPFKGEQGVDYQGNVVQNLGLNLSVPLVTGGSRIARVQQAKIQQDQIEIAKTQLIDNLKLQYATAIAEYDFALNTYNIQKHNTEISKKIRDVSSKKFTEGIISSLEFTQTENQYQDALKSAIEAANNVLNKKVQLEKIIGKYNNK